MQKHGCKETLVNPFRARLLHTTRSAPCKTLYGDLSIPPEHMHGSQGDFRPSLPPNSTVIRRLSSIPAVQKHDYKETRQSLPSKKHGYQETLYQSLPLHRAVIPGDFYQSVPLKSTIQFVYTDQRDRFSHPRPITDAQRLLCIDTY